jgi:hypothetical protein
MENIDKYIRTVDSVNNARQVVIDTKQKNPYILFQETGIPQYGTNIIKADFDKSTLNELYFSRENLEQIQNSVRFNVYTLSEGKYTIGKQSDTELIIIMRSIFFQHSKNITNKDTIKAQISELNKLVVNDISPKILSQIQQHYGYLRDSTKRMEPHELPKNTNLFSRRITNSTTPF